MQLDFFASLQHYYSHLAPIWRKLDESERGRFYLPTGVIAEPDIEGVFVARQPHPGDNPIVVCAYANLLKAHSAGSENRPVVLLEHGTGLAFGGPSYADGAGRRNEASLFLMPNEVVARKLNLLPHQRAAVIGCPMLDDWHFTKMPFVPEKPTIALTFHWGDDHSNPPESGSAFGYYKDVIRTLQKTGKYHFVGHGHPIREIEYKQFFQSLGIEWIPQFKTVAERADILVNDCSSIAYMYCVTGKPVILLNSPKFRRDVDFGIRFWEYSDIGINVERPEHLAPALERTIAQPDEHKEQREKAVRDLYPYLGTASERAVAELRKFFHEPEMEKIEVVESREKGIIYMAFGERSKSQLVKSLRSLRKTGNRLPVVVVGDQQVEGAGSIPWTGHSPFDLAGAKNFKFLAGYVKPFFYGLSPFERSMYLDCDTEFLQDPLKGFNFLNHWDFAIAQERLSINQLYNQPLAGWRHDLQERDVTIEEYGADWFPFVNSGLFYWKKNERVEELFRLWYEEWLRWPFWEEQKALMRAMNRASAKILVLSEAWNGPHRQDQMEKLPGARIVYHEYGRGIARSNPTEEKK